MPTKNKENARNGRNSDFTGHKNTRAALAFPRPGNYEFFPKNEIEKLLLPWGTVPFDEEFREARLPQIFFGRSGMMNEMEQFRRHSHIAIAAIMKEVLHRYFSREIAEQRN